MQVLLRDLPSNLAGIADYEKKLGSDAEETPQPLMSSQRIPTMKDTQMDSLFTAVPARDSERLCCTKCRFSTRDTVLFARHVSHHDEMTFCCSLCSHVSYSKTESDRHLVFHTGLFPFSCSLCNYGAVRRDYVLKHIKRIHKMPTSESRSMAARVVQASKPPAFAAKQQISSEAGTAPRLPRVQVRLSTQKSSSLHRTLQADSSAIRPLPAAHSSSPASVQVELLAPLQQPLQHNSPLTVSCPERLQIPAGCVLELVQVKAVNGTQELELRVIPAAEDTGKASTTVAEAEPVPSQETSLCLTEKSSIAGESGHGNKPGNRHTLTLPTSTRHSDVLPVISSVYSLCPALTTRSQKHNVTSTRSQLHNTSPRSRLHNTSIRSLLKNNTTTYSQLRKNTMAHSQLLKRTSTQSQLHNSTYTKSQLHNNQSKHSQLQNNPPTQSQLHNNTSTRSQSNNNSSTHSQLHNDTTTHSQLLNSTTTHPQLLNNTTTHSLLENKRTTLFQLVNKAATHSQPNNTGSCSQLNSIQTLSKNSQIQNNTTAYSRLLYSQTTHLQLHDTTTHSQPQNSTATYSQPQINTITPLQPKDNKTTHSQTQDNTATPLWPQNNTSAHPQNNKATHSQPQNSTPAHSHSQPQNNTTKNPQPKNNKTTHSHPQKNTTTHLQPNNNTATHSEPQMNTIAHLQPQNDTTTLSQPQNNTTTHSQLLNNTTTHSWTQGKTHRAEIKTEAEEQIVSLSCPMPDIKAEMADDNSPTMLLTSLGTSVNCPHLSPRVSIARLLVPELEKKATKEILSQKPSSRLSVKRKACKNLPERVGLPESENMTASEELCKPESLKRRHNETNEVNEGTKQSCGLKVPPLKLALLKSTSLKLVPLRADQLVQAPSRDQPVVVLNHPSPASRRMGVRMKLKKVQGKTYRVMQLLLDV